MWLVSVIAARRYFLTPQKDKDDTTFSGTENQLISKYTIDTYLPIDTYVNTPWRKARSKKIFALHKIMTMTTPTCYLRLQMLPIA